jgi:hypothetical protein
VDLAVVAQNTVQHLEGEVPASALSLDVFQKTDSLNVVEEIPQPSMPAKLGQEPFPIVTERRMTDVMPQSDRLNQVLVQPEEAAYGSGHF